MSSNTKLITIDKFIKAVVEKEHQMLADGKIDTAGQRFAQVEKIFTSIIEEISKDDFTRN